MTGLNLWHSFLGIAALGTGLAALWDLRTGKIPNALPLALAGAGIVARIFWLRSEPGELLKGLVDSMLGIIICGAVPLLLWRLKAMGGGDVKLLAAVGCVMGMLGGLQVQLYSFVAAVMVAPLVLAYRGRLLPALGSTLHIALNPFRPKAKRRAVCEDLLTELRFGPAVFGGVVFVIVSSFYL